MPDESRTYNLLLLNADHVAGGSDAASMLLSQELGVGLGRATRLLEDAPGLIADAMPEGEATALMHRLKAHGFGIRKVKAGTVATASGSFERKKSGILRPVGRKRTGSADATRLADDATVMASDPHRTRKPFKTGDEATVSSGDFPPVGGGFDDNPRTEGGYRPRPSGEFNRVSGSGVSKSIGSGGFARVPSSPGTEDFEDRPTTFGGRVTGPIERLDLSGSRPAVSDEFTRRPSSIRRRESQADPNSGGFERVPSMRQIHAPDEVPGGSDDLPLEQVPGGSHSPGRSPASGSHTPRRGTGAFERRASVRRKITGRLDPITKPISPGEDDATRLPGRQVQNLPRHAVDPSATQLGLNVHDERLRASGDHPVANPPTSGSRDVPLFDPANDPPPEPMLAPEQEDKRFDPKAFALPGQLHDEDDALGGVPLEALAEDIARDPSPPSDAPIDVDPHATHFEERPDSKQVARLGEARPSILDEMMAEEAPISSGPSIDDLLDAAGVPTAGGDQLARTAFAADSVDALLDEAGVPGGKQRTTHDATAFAPSTPSDPHALLDHMGVKTSRSVAPDNHPATHPEVDVNELSFSRLISGNTAAETYDEVNVDLGIRKDEGYAQRSDSIEFAPARAPSDPELDMAAFSSVDDELEAAATFDRAPPPEPDPTEPVPSPSRRRPSAPSDPFADEEPVSPGELPRRRTSETSVPAPGRRSSTGGVSIDEQLAGRRAKQDRSVFVRVVIAALVFVGVMVALLMSELNRRSTPEWIFANSEEFAEWRIGRDADAPRRGCARSDEDTWLCKYTAGFYAGIYPRAEESIHNAASRMCITTHTDDGRSMRETLDCTISGPFGEVRLRHEDERECDASLATLSEGGSARCETQSRASWTLDGEEQANGESRLRVLTLTFQGESRVETFAGEIDAIELLVSGDGTRSVVSHYAPSLMQVVRQNYPGMGEHLSLSFLQNGDAQSGTAVIQR